MFGKMSSLPTFIMPLYCKYPHQVQYLKEAIEGLLRQSDPRWQLLIIDDASVCKEQIDDFFKTLADEVLAKISFTRMDQNRGPGFCRNIGAEIAATHNVEFILYHDADDISHPDRLKKTREIFESQPDMDLIYTTFKVINERSEIVSPENIPKPAMAALKQHENPPQGPYAWRDIGIKTGYVSLTSATSVRTKLALNYPFPNEYFSEDSHTWFRMFAGSRQNCFCGDFPTLYRIHTDTKFGSASRDILIQRGIDPSKEKIRVDTDGFKQAISIAIDKGLILPEDKDSLLEQFNNILTKDIKNEGPVNQATSLMI